MSRSFAAALFAAALIGAPAVAFAAESPAAQPTPSADEATQGAAAEVTDPNRKVCKKVDVTGYRLRKTRVCATVAEWEARKQEDRQSTNRMQTQLPKKAPGE